MKNGKKNLVQLTDGALLNLQESQQRRIAEHFNELKGDLETKVAAREMVLRAVLQGLPQEDLPALDVEADQLMRRVDILAEAFARKVTQERYAGLKELIAHLNITDLPAHIKWAAKRNGVELFPDAPAPVEQAPVDANGSPIILNG